MRIVVQPEAATSFFRLFDESGPDLKARLVSIYGLLGVLNIGAWLWAFAAFHDTARRVAAELRRSRWPGCLHRYSSHTDVVVRLYLQETFTFLLLTAEAAVALAPPASGR